MKDSEFIELLNLYLDHEISAADAARLEAEVQRNPARRQIYRQYCQMQKACSMLVSDFAAEPSAEKVVAFEPARSAWRSVVWGVGGLAAAASVALVFLNRNAPVAPSVSAPQVAVVEPQTPPPASEVRTITRTVTTAARSAELQPVLTTGSLRLANNQSGLVMAPAQFEWMNGVKITPLPQAPSVEELLRFEKHQTMKPEPAVYRSNRPIQGNVEMTAFQFQK